MPPSTKGRNTGRTTPKGTRSKKGAEVDTIRIKYDGEVYDVPRDPDDVPWRIRVELMNQSGGLTLGGMMQLMAAGQVDSLMVAAYLFVGRRMAGQSVKFDGDVDMGLLDNSPDEDDAPEA